MALYSGLCKLAFNAVYHIYQTLTFIVLWTIEPLTAKYFHIKCLVAPEKHFNTVSSWLRSPGRDMMTGGMKLSINCVYCGYKGNWPALLFTYSATNSRVSSLAKIFHHLQRIKKHRFVCSCLQSSV